MSHWEEIWGGVIEEGGGSAENLDGFGAVMIRPPINHHNISTYTTPPPNDPSTVRTGPCDIPPHIYTV